MATMKLIACGILALAPFAIVGAVLVRMLRAPRYERDVASFDTACDHGSHDWCDECDGNPAPPEDGRCICEARMAGECMCGAWQRGS